MLILKPEQNLDYYRSQHQTLGCRITHLIGIPMILFSLPTLLFSWKLALSLFLLGWLLQFIGHFVFEKNSPVLLTSSRSPQTLFSALSFAAYHWVDLFRTAKSKEALAKTSKSLD